MCFQTKRNSLALVLVHWQLKFPTVEIGMFTQEQWSKIVGAGLDVIVTTPQLLLLVFLARMSGQLWLYLYIAYFKSSAKNNQFLNNHTGTTALGLLTFVPVFVITYYTNYGPWAFEFERALGVIGTSMAFWLMLQLFVFLSTVLWKAPK